MSVCLSPVNIVPYSVIIVCPFSLKMFVCRLQPVRLCSVIYSPVNCKLSVPSTVIIVRPSLKSIDLSVML